MIDLNDMSKDPLRVAVVDALGGIVQQAAQARCS